MINAKHKSYLEPVNAVNARQPFFLPGLFKILLLGKMPVEEPGYNRGYYEYHGRNYDPEYRASDPLDGLRYDDYGRHYFSSRSRFLG